jgi:hypothetical protein
MDVGFIGKVSFSDASAEDSLLRRRHSSPAWRNWITKGSRGGLMTAFVTRRAPWAANSVPR